MISYNPCQGCDFFNKPYWSIINPCTNCPKQFTGEFVTTTTTSMPPVEYTPVRHGRCDVCAGKAIMTEDFPNGYSLEVDAEQQELSIWCGNECLAIFQIGYCPNCGAKLDLEEDT